jgi:type I restriction enzyme S subunit
MRKYENYKDSGVEWIGDIPSHWDVTRIKYQYQIGRGRVISNEDLVDNGIYPVYSSQTLNNGCLGFIDTYDFDDKLITWTTDGANAGTVFLREGKFNCTNVCGTLEAKSDEIIPEFHYYFLQYATQFYKRPDTNGAKIMNNEMAVILSLKLSSDEQTAIANYLDQKTSEIDNLIAKKERLIHLLEEEQTAIINQAVTKGLDPNVPMKDSGIEWLGEIPAHWEVKPMKYIVKDLKSGVSVNSEDVPVSNEFQLGILKTSCVYNYSFRAYENKQVIQQEYERVRCPVKKNSIIISRMNTPELVGASGFVEEDFPNLFLPDRLWITEFYDNIEINVKWLSLILISDLYKKTLSSKATGTSPSMKNISKDDFLTIPIPYAPFIEQCKIDKYLSTKDEKIEEIISKYQKEIELLKEYKTVLISEVVTGKVDVRNEKMN